MPARTVQELIALLKGKPGEYNFASSGAGSTQHIAAELFKDATGVQITHIPYRGSGPAMVDLMGGRVQIAFETASSVIPHIKSGKVRALAVLSAARNPQLPDVPTMAEAGVPGVEMSAWYGIYMPSGTPAAIQRRARRGQRHPGAVRHPRAPAGHRRRRQPDEPGTVRPLPSGREPALRRDHQEEPHFRRVKTIMHPQHRTAGQPAQDRPSSP